MECTVSVSKGVFLFPNGFKSKKKRLSKKKSKHDKLFTTEQWYETYKMNWTSIETQLEELHNRTYSVLLNDIVNYVKSYSEHYEPTDDIIPSATLLTGVNRPDHTSQFEALVHKIREEVTPHIAMVNSQDAPTLKHLVESVVWQLINETNTMDISEDENTDCHSPNKKLRKNKCTMKELLTWYQTRYLNVTPKKKKLAPTKKSLVIIFSDFESFSSSALQDFVMIASSYVSKLPLIFVFGVATSVSAIHKSFPYHVSSKLLIKVFHSHASDVFINQVLEEVFLTHTCPLHLSGKAFQLLTDVFFFYDFSVTGLVQSIKYCMMEHYYGDNRKILCCGREKLDEAIKKLSNQDLEQIRQLLSFRQFLEAQDLQTQVKLFNDDEFFSKVLRKEVHKLHDYLYSFYACVRLLKVFTSDLPKNMLGKTIREIYTKCVSEPITETQAFKECMQLLNFQSQVQLAETIKLALKQINTTLQTLSPVKPLRSTPTKNNLDNIRLNDTLGESFIKSVRIHLSMFLKRIEQANTKRPDNARMPTDEEDNLENVVRNRIDLQAFLKAIPVKRTQSEFDMIRTRFTGYLSEMFSKALQPPHTRAFNEILFFSDVDAVKKQIVGSPRGALHTALSNPVHYLQCTCCHLPSADSMSATLPDVCLAYKLHRECGKLVNLYDWLQAFGAVLAPPQDDEDVPLDANVQSSITAVESRGDPERKPPFGLPTLIKMSGNYRLFRILENSLNTYIPVVGRADLVPTGMDFRARFMRAVAEMQFLGFIKSSKRKTDHVMRLTW